MYIHDLELFVTVQIHDDTLAVLSLGKLCEEHGYSYEWTSGQKPQLTKTVKNSVQYGTLRAYCCSRIVDRFLKLERKFVLHIVTARHVWWYPSSPASQRSDDTHARASRNRGDPTKNKNKNMDNSQASSNRMRDLRVWLEFTENLENTEVPALRDTPANTSQDSDSERPVEVVLRKAQY